VKGDPPLTGGPLKGITLDIEEMVRLTWKNFGWNENTGVPEDKLINDLQLNELIE
jgi:aldehyde:ferredoxin oxidoreductase